MIVNILMKTGATNRHPRDKFLMVVIMTRIHHNQLIIGMTKIGTTENRNLNNTSNREM